MVVRFLGNETKLQPNLVEVELWLSLAITIFVYFNQIRSIVEFAVPV